MLLENVWKPIGTPIALLDTRVYMHNFCKHWPQDCDTEHAYKVFYARWAELINKPFPWIKHQPANWQVALIDDYKDERGKYWRYDLYPEYKANRHAIMPPVLSTCYKALLEYLADTDTQVPMFRQVGFEADDFSGLFARLKRNGVAEGRQLLIGTSDYDHQQLVSDKHDILWANALKYSPRLRSEYEMLDVHKRRGIILATPASLVAHKQQFGDFGDNIFPGAPAEIIDLIDPPVKPDEAEAKAWLSTVAPNTCEKHWLEAVQWLVTNAV